MRYMSFSVLGQPAGQGSKSIVQPKGHKRPMMIEASKKTEPYRQMVHDAAVLARPPGWEPLTIATVNLWAYYQRPKSHFRTGLLEGVLREDAREYPTVKPDLDKITRLVLDSLSTARILKDDCVVVDLALKKRYATTTAPSGVVVTIVEGAGD